VRRYTLRVERSCRGPTHTVTLLNRLPVRVRVTLAFTGAMAVVLIATGLFLGLRFVSQFDAALDQGLRTRVDDVTALLQQRDVGLSVGGRSRLTENGENLAQVLDARGRVVDATPTLRGRSLLTPEELARARRGTFTLDARAVPPEGDRARVLATPVRARGRAYVVAVGVPAELREDALHNLVSLLLIGGPAALALASLAGYGAAGVALRPVERMRSRAAAVQAGRADERLPVPEAQDEIRRLGETLNEMLERLHSAFARERAFVSDASHELRTPLAILKAELELALRGGQDVAQLEEALRSAADETDRLVQLAEDLLVIARFDQGRLPIRLAVVSVRILLEDVTRRFDRRAAEAGARLTIDADADLVVDADGLRLEQAISNLVDNALRHGGTDVTLAARREEGDVVVHVRDDGPGFSDAFLPSAFERFTRADVARGHGGSGLGLAIVAAIAQAHGGRAGTDRADNGADVWIRLPGGAVAGVEGR